VALRPRGCAQPLLTYGSFAEYPAAQATLTTFGSIQIKYGRARLKRPPRPKGVGAGRLASTDAPPGGTQDAGPAAVGLRVSATPTVGGRLDHFVPHRQN
jgi:hypothetical protein